MVYFCVAKYTAVTKVLKIIIIYIFIINNKYTQFTINSNTKKHFFFFIFGPISFQNHCGIKQISLDVNWFRSEQISLDVDQFLSEYLRLDIVQFHSEQIRLDVVQVHSEYIRLDLVQFPCWKIYSLHPNKLCQTQSVNHITIKPEHYGLCYQGLL